MEWNRQACASNVFQVGVCSAVTPSRPRQTLLGREDWVYSQILGYSILFIPNPQLERIKNFEGLTSLAISRTTCCTENAHKILSGVGRRWMHVRDVFVTAQSSGSVQISCVKAVNWWQTSTAKRALFFTFKFGLLNSPATSDICVNANLVSKSLASIDRKGWSYPQEYGRLSDGVHHLIRLSETWFMHLII